MDKGTKSLKQLIYIPKLSYQVIADFALEFLGGKGLKPKKKSIVAANKWRYNSTVLSQLPQLLELPTSAI